MARVVGETHRDRDRLALFAGGEGVRRGGGSGDGVPTGGPLVREGSQAVGVGDGRGAGGERLAHLSRAADGRLARGRAVGRRRRVVVVGEGDGSGIVRRRCHGVAGSRQDGHRDGTVGLVHRVVVRAHQERLVAQHGHGDRLRPDLTGLGVVAGLGYRDIDAHRRNLDRLQLDDESAEAAFHLVRPGHYLDHRKRRLRRRHRARGRAGQQLVVAGVVGETHCDRDELARVGAGQGVAGGGSPDDGLVVSKPLVGEGSQAVGVGDG